VRLTLSLTPAASLWTRAVTIHGGKERKYGYCPKCLIEVANVVTSGIISIRLAGESKNNILWQRKSPSSTYAAPVACVGSVIRICFRSMLPRAISLQPTPKQPPKIRI